MDDVALSKKGVNYSWEKMHDLTLSEYTVIHQHFPAFLPACFEFTTPPLSLLPPRLDNLIEGAGGLRRRVKSTGCPRFVKVYFLAVI